MGTTIQFTKLPAVTTDTQRVYWHWFGQSRWTYLHCARHRCGIPRADGRNRYLWLALGPLDLRVHY
jgi:hypothetical protein